jgi:hypothetical protein
MLMCSCRYIYYKIYNILYIYLYYILYFIYNIINHDNINNMYHNNNFLRLTVKLASTPMTIA